MMPNDSSDSQIDTLRLFTVLTGLRAYWPGQLIVSCGLGPVGCAVSLAANVAGAACLSIEPDAAICRTAMRAGACDFLVNTVDEALRVLKNEIRQRKALSVALELDLSGALEELLQRGVLPELFTVTASLDPIASACFADVLQPCGMSVLDEAEVSTRLMSLLQERNHVLHTRTFESAAALKRFDARLQEVIPATHPRHRWVLAAPRLFHRERPYRRAVLITAEELTALG